MKNSRRLIVVLKPGYRALRCRAMRVRPLTGTPIYDIRE